MKQNKWWSSSTASSTMLDAKPSNVGVVNFSDKFQKRRAPKDDVIQVDGRVVDTLPNAMFRVQVEPSKQIILATICGKIRKNNVKIILGDIVQCEISVYDLTKGRIVFRNR